MFITKTQYKESDTSRLNYHPLIWNPESTYFLVISRHKVKIWRSVISCELDCTAMVMYKWVLQQPLYVKKDLDLV